MQLFYDVITTNKTKETKCERFDTPLEARAYIAKLPKKKYYVLNLVMCNDDFSGETKTMIDERDGE